ncbi:MAG: ABC transporter permease [bacterium]|nr:ABC transporter permease [bacterium]
MTGALRFPGLTAVALILAAWVTATATGFVNSEFIPPPGEVLAAGIEDWANLGSATIESMWTALVGYAVGFGAAVVIGMAVGRYASVDSWLSGPLDFFRAIPAVAIVPMALLILADSFLVGAFAVAWGCFFLAVINVISGVKHIPNTLQDAARSFGAGEVKVLRKVGIPSLLPYFLSSLRQNVSVALIVIVVADMVIGLSGLGFYILRTQSNALFGRMYASIALIAVIGYVAFRILEEAQRRLFPWWSETSLA